MTIQINNNFARFLRGNPKSYLEVKRRKIDLTITENPLGCSPLVKKTFNNLSCEISSYPNTKTLTELLAKRFNVNEGSLLLGNGSEMLIDFICRFFLNQNDQVLIPKTTTFLFKRAIILAGGKPLLMPMEENQNINLNLIASELKNNIKMCIIANPNNPTGELIKKKRLLELINKFTKTIFVIDEANIEFSDENESLVNMAPEINNLLVLRSFSKGFGLAGSRIGCLIANKKIIEQMKLVIQAFPVSSISISIAEIALKDKQFLQKTKKFSQSQRMFLIKTLTSLGFKISSSKSNNLLVQIPDKIDSKKFLKDLNNNNVSVIPGSYFDGLNDSFFRINIQGEKVNQQFIKIIKKIIKEENVK